MTDQMQRGAWGERVAERRLRMRGWRIVARRYRAAGGEIDIAAARGGVLAICEVKTRARAGITGPVGMPQVVRIRRATTVLHASRPDLAGLDVRLDLIIVTPRRLGLPRVRHLAGALEE